MLAAADLFDFLVNELAGLPGRSLPRASGLAGLLDSSLFGHRSILLLLAHTVPSRLRSLPTRSARSSTRLRKASGVTLARIPRMRARRDLMRQIPAEIDFGRHKLAVAHGVHLAIAEALACRGASFVHDEGAVAVVDLMNVVDVRHCRAVRPANPQISRAIERIVDRACEVIVVGEQRFQGGAVLVDVGLEACARDGQGGLAHDQISLGLDQAFRNEWKHRRSSSVNRSGTSSEAKCPPRSSSFQ